VAVDGDTLTLTVSRESLGDPDRILLVMGVGREGQGEQATSGDLFPDNTEAGPITHAAYWFSTEGDGS
jgi:hypothetical protein